MKKYGLYFCFTKVNIKRERELFWHVGQSSRKGREFGVGKTFPGMIQSDV